MHEHGSPWTRSAVWTYTLHSMRGGASPRCSEWTSGRHVAQKLSLPPAKVLTLVLVKLPRAENVRGSLLGGKPHRGLTPLTWRALFQCTFSVASTPPIQPISLGSPFRGSARCRLSESALRGSPRTASKRPSRARLCFSLCSPPTALLGKSVCSAGKKRELALGSALTSQ